MASRFTADAFDDALDDDDLDGFGEDNDDEDDSYHNTNGRTMSHVIELSQLDKGRLSLKEVNG